jgi:hypothetical protein
MVNYPSLVNSELFTFAASSTIRIRSDDFATAITCLPLPLPCAAPSMIPVSIS